MWRRAASEDASDWPSLTPNPPLVMGTVVVIDIDRLSRRVEEEGLSEYSPNEYTGLLSNLVDGLVRRWSAYLVYGLDWERGTEEAVLEIAGVEPGEVAGDLIRVAVEMCEAGAPVTIVAVSAPVGARVAGGGASRRSAYQGARAWARRLLEAAKRKGGGVVVVDGDIVYRCSGSTGQA